MQTFELFITDTCNRNCSFCYVPKGNFKTSIFQAKEFYNQVSKEATTYYEISIFGGEPLIAFDIVLECISLFDKEDLCKSISIYTNADLLSEDLVSSLQDFSNKVKICITAYDIFSNSGFEKYANFISKSTKNNISISYTFEESNIEYLQEFKRLSNVLGVPCKVAFSHYPESWSFVSPDSITYKLLEDFYYDELVDLSERARVNDFTIPKVLDKYLKRCVQFILDTSESLSCNGVIGDDKKVFYNGNFIGHCIRFKFYPTINSLPVLPKIPKHCVTCEYNKICTKSCMAEWTKNRVPTSLCLLEKVAITTTLEFANKNIDNPGWQNLLAFLITDYNSNITFKTK